MLIQSMLMLAVLGLTFLQTESEFIPKCKSSFAWFRHPQDCGRKYQCVFGSPVEMPRCHTHEVFSSVYGVCVRVGSTWDDCKLHSTQQGNNTQLTIKERCDNGEERIAHPEHCARYYDCSLMYNQVPRYFEQHLDECEYPKLFNTDTKTCDNFEHVQCGERNEPVDGCDYIRNKCPVGHCEPCIYRYPSCNGKPDGLQVFPERERTPFYMECYKDRTIHSGFCEQTPGSITLFSPVTKSCVRVAEITDNFDDIMPVCDGKGTGLHPVEQPEDCMAYYSCKDGWFDDIHFCEDGTKFNRKTSLCMDPKLFCGTCGEKELC